MTPKGPHGPRRGVFERAGDGCRFSSSTSWYNVRGAVASLLPQEFTAKPPLAGLPQLPAVPDPIHPPNALLPGATDPDKDGHPGAAYLITGIVDGNAELGAERLQGVRHAGRSVEAAAIGSTRRAGRQRVQENILSVTKCGSACSLIASQGYVDPKLVPRVRFPFFGQDAQQVQHRDRRRRAASVGSGCRRSHLRQRARRGPA